MAERKRGMGEHSGADDEEREEQGNLTLWGILDIECSKDIG